MEQVLEVYKRPYDPAHPVVCMDEQPKQLISEVSAPLPAAPDRPERADYEYVREGVCAVWMFVEPLGGWRAVDATDTRTKVDWAHQVRRIVDDPRFAAAQRITLVCDNLNTHALASLYAAFEPAEALRIARRLELVHTPKHGSWLNVAESELSAGPPHPCSTNGCRRGHRLEQATQRGPNRRGLALHHRGRTHPAQAPLSQNRCLTDH
jgi:hypothetical protein